MTLTATMFHHFKEVKPFEKYICKKCSRVYYTPNGMNDLILHLMDKHRGVFNVDRNTKGMHFIKGAAAGGK